jgi:5-methylcytosine-specific restriction endonuclease McrA
MNRHYAPVAERSGHRREYCHAPEAIFNLPFEVEHIVPTSRDGADDESNLALACRACSLYKSTVVSSTLICDHVFKKHRLQRSGRHSLDG